MKKTLLVLFLVSSIAVNAQETTPKMVIENYIKAIGGKDAINAIRDFSMELTAEMQGQSMSMVVKKKMPNKFLTVVTVDGMGEVNNTVFDGEKGKVASMGQEQMVEGEDAKKLAAQGNIIGEIQYLDDLGKLSYLGKENIDGVECHTLKILNAAGEAKEYYEVESGLKKRQINDIESPMGKMTITIDYADYKAVAGIKFPHLLKQDMGIMAFDFKTKEILVNSNLDDALFEVK
jgi:zinc protease